MKKFQIKLQIESCEAKIHSKKKAIVKEEREYSSAAEFRHRIDAYQDRFCSSNQRELQALAAVAQITDNCDPAARYYKGMERLVNTNGKKIANGLLQRLSESARETMRKSLRDIEKLEEEIAYLETKIQQLRKELKIAEMEEALANANK